MQLFSARRLFAGLAVVGAVLAAGAAPALAAPAADITVTLPDITVATGAQGTPLEPSWRADQEVVLAEPTMTYELSGDLDGVSIADGSGVGQCTAESPTRLVCSDPFEMGFGPDGSTGYFTALVTADDDASDGATGTVTATFAAQGLDPITTTARVRVAEGVDLAAGRDVKLSAKPGAAISVPLVVRNAGRNVVDGAAVIFHADHAFQTTTTFRNCRYREGRLTACTFDQALQPGGAYRGAMPYRLGKDTMAPGGSSAELEWLTPAELADHEAYLQANNYPGLGEPGTGRALTLARQASARQADVDPDNNWTNVDVKATGKNGADLVSVGADVRGAAGDQVTVAVGVRNQGPATVDSSRVGEPAARTNVAIPPGTTVVTVPEGCIQVVDGQPEWDTPAKPGHRAYLCLSDNVLVAGTAETYEFGLRIDEVIADATGTVSVNEPCECSQFDKDLDMRNNKAAIVVNGTGAGSGGSGGGLPVTGPMGAAIAGTGAALLLAGAVGFLVARRRRTRFVA